MKTRILAFFLTLCMILSMVPAVAFAEEVETPVVNPGTTVDSAMAFANALSAGAEKITISGDGITGIFTAYTSVTIDVNGHSLTGATIATAGSAVVTIEDSKAKSDEAVALDAAFNGDVVIKSAKLENEHAYETFWATDSKLVTGELYLIPAQPTDYVVKIGAVNYVRFPNAVDAAQAGETITFLKDATVSVNADKNLTFELNGKAVTFESITAGNVLIQSTETIATLAVDEIDGADVTFKNVEMAARPNAKNGGTIYAQSGMYEFVLDTAEMPTKAIQVGGWVVVAANNADIVAVINDTAKGFASVAEALKDPEASKGIILIADEKEYLPVGRDVEINLNGNDITGTFIINSNKVTLTGSGNVAAVTVGGGKLVIGGTVSVTTLSSQDGSEVLLDGGHIINVSAALGKIVLASGHIDETAYDAVGGSKALRAGSVAVANTPIEIREAKYLIKDTEGEVRIGYDTFAEAYNGAEAGETIVVNENFELAETLVIEKAITLDLNGHTLSDNIDDNTMDVLIEVDAEGTVTIENGTISANGDCLPVEIYGGTVVVKATVTSTDDRAAISLYNGNLVVEAGSAITSTNLSAIVSNENGDDNPVDAPAVTVTINGGTVTSSDSFYALYMAGGKLTVSKDADATIAGGKHAVYAICDSDVALKGGNFTSKGDVVGVYYIYEHEEMFLPEVSIEGGEFTVPDGKKFVNVVKYDNGETPDLTEEQAKIYKGIVTGGTFNGVTTENYAEFVELLNKDVAPKADFEFGEDLVVDPDAEYVIAVNGVKYSSWAAAWDAAVEAQGGAARPTFQAIENTTDIVAAGNVDLDLNGKTLAGLTLKSDVALYVFSNVAGAKITDTINVESGRVIVTVNGKLSIDVEDAKAPVINVVEGNDLISKIQGTGKVTVEKDVAIVTGDATKVTIIGGVWNIDPTYLCVPYGYVIEKNTPNDADPYWTIASETVVAEILPRDGAVSVERFTSVAEAVDYYLANYANNDWTHYIKVFNIGVDNNRVLDVTDIENLVCDLAIPFLFEDGAAFSDVANNDKYVALVKDADVSLNGATYQIYWFKPTVAQVEGGAYYATVDAAIEAAAVDAIINVLDSEQTFTVTKNVTINLNGTEGHNVTVVEDVSATVHSGSVAVAEVYGTLANRYQGAVQIDELFVYENGTASIRRSTSVVDNVNVAAGGSFYIDYGTTITGVITLADGVKAVSLGVSKLSAKNSDTLRNYVNADCTWTATQDGYAVVLTSEIAAMIGDFAYTTLQAALNAATNNAVITFYKNNGNDNTIPYGLTVKIVDSSATEDPSILTTVRVDANIVRWDTIVTVGDDGTTYSAKNRVAIVDGVKYYEDTFTSEVLKGAANVAIHDITNITEDIVIDGATVEMIFAANTKEDNAKTITVNSGTITSMPTATYAPGVKVLIGSVENVRIVVDPTTAEWDFVKGVAEKASVYFVENNGAWVIKNAPVTADGVGYPTIQAAVTAGKKNIELLDDVTTDAAIALTDGITLDLGGFVLTLNTADGPTPETPAITVTGTVTIKNGEIALLDNKGNDNYVLINVDGNLTVEGLTIPKAFGYDDETGKNISIFLAASTDAEMPTTLYIAKDTKILGLVVCAESNVAEAVITNLAKATIEGPFTCAEHEAADADGCENCGLTAYSITLKPGVVLTTDLVEGEDYTVVDGVYWFYAGDLVSFSKDKSATAPEFGQYFYGFTVNTNYTVPAENTVVDLVWEMNDTSKITINAGSYYVTVEGAGINNELFTGVESFAIPQGAVATFTYGVKGANVIWVNASGKIVAVGETVEYTVSASDDTLTAHEIGDKKIVILNGELKLGSTVLSIGTYTPLYAWPALPETIGVKEVEGWALNGEGDYTTLADLKQAIKDSDATNFTVTPVFRKVSGTIDYFVDGIQEDDITVNFNGITRVTAPVVDGKHFDRWEVYEDINGLPVYTTSSATIAYAFAEGMTLKAVYDENVVSAPDFEITATGKYDPVAKKFTVVVHYVINGQKYTLTSVAVQYSVDGDTYYTKSVNNVAGLDDVTYTLNLNNAAGHENLYVKASLTYVDENGQTLVYNMTDPAFIIITYVAQ